MTFEEQIKEIQMLARESENLYEENMSMWNGYEWGHYSDKEKIDKTYSTFLKSSDILKCF